jgi:hypothetical protein
MKYFILSLILCLIGCARQDVLVKVLINDKPVSNVYLESNTFDKPLSTDTLGQRLFKEVSGVKRGYPIDLNLKHSSKISIIDTTYKVILQDTILIRHVDWRRRFYEIRLQDQQDSLAILKKRAEKNLAGAVTLQMRLATHLDIYPESLLKRMQVDSNNFKKIAQQIEEALRKVAEARQEMENTTLNPEIADQTIHDAELTSKSAETEVKLAETELKKLEIALIGNSDVDIPSGILFGSGAYELSDANKQKLKLYVDTIMTNIKASRLQYEIAFPNTERKLLIKVSGFADNVAVSNPEKKASFKQKCEALNLKIETDDDGNGHLSALRAYEVSQLVTKQLTPILPEAIISSVIGKGSYLANQLGGKKGDVEAYRKCSISFLLEVVVPQ